MTTINDSPYLVDWLATHLPMFHFSYPFEIVGVWFTVFAYALSILIIYFILHRFFSWIVTLIIIHR